MEAKQQEIFEKKLEQLFSFNSHFIFSRLNRDGFYNSIKEIQNIILNKKPRITDSILCKIKERFSLDYGEPQRPIFECEEKTDYSFLKNCEDFQEFEAMEIQEVRYAILKKAIAIICVFKAIKDSNLKVIKTGVEKDLKDSVINFKKHIYKIAGLEVYRIKLLKYLVINNVLTKEEAQKMSSEDTIDFVNNIINPVIQSIYPKRKQKESEFEKAKKKIKVTEPNPKKVHNSQKCI